jgi:Ca2+-binding EF-hand superfamily protein
MDFDFDGFISIEDLKTFLVQVLEIREIVETKLERLFKLLDYSKSGKI